MRHLLAALLVLLGAPAAARVLEVGPGHALRTPGQAATLARDGDRIEIEPGTYVDCAIWRASRIEIAARGPGVVVTGPVCAERGLFVVLDDDVAIRGIVFRGARSVYRNGAGVRAFGANLTIEGCRFLDNENGILAGGPTGSDILVAGSEFVGNGSCEGACAHGVYIGAAITLARFEGNVFRATRTAHHIKSRARTTIVAGNRIEDGPNGTASYLVETPNGGDLLVLDNVLHKGPLTGHPQVTISVGIEGASNPTATLIFQGNRFLSDSPEDTVFVRNATTAPAILIGNRLTGRVSALTGPGEVRP